MLSSEDATNRLKGRYRAGGDDHAGVRSETSNTHAAAVIWLRGQAHSNPFDCSQRWKRKQVTHVMRESTWISLSLRHRRIRVIGPADNEIIHDGQTEQQSRLSGDAGNFTLTDDDIRE